MKLLINPNKLSGEISPPPSKSLSHRAIIAASLSDGLSIIDNIALSDDVIATCEAMENFGVVINRGKSHLEVSSVGKLIRPIHPINCKESGSTLRFLIPFASLVDEPVIFDGVGGLRTRPLTPYVDIFKKNDVRCIYEDELPMIVEGSLKPGKYEITGDISSQFITGLMFVLPTLDGDSVIEITSELESKGYIDLTLDYLKEFGIEIANNQYKEFVIKGNQKYQSKNITVESDFSQAAFWVVAGLIGNGLTLKNLNMDSNQGDKAILDITKAMQGKINNDSTTLSVEKSNTVGTIIDASQCPDIVPILAVLGALSEGETKIINAGRLRIKESDRLKAISTELTKLGADIKETEDGLVINGKSELCGGEVEGWGDHRIVMSLAIASIRCSEPVVINGWKAIEKSYPTFFKDFEKLGGETLLI